MTKGIRITHDGFYSEFNFQSNQELQDGVNGYFEQINLIAIDGVSEGVMWVNEMGHGLVNTPASAISFIFGGASTITGNVVLSGATDDSGNDTDISAGIRQLVEWSCIPQTKWDEENTNV
jgi:hypothetical protein